VSHLERSLGENLPEHYLGLTNFGNSCYVNSVVQALYFCRPFRKEVLAYQQTADEPDTLLSLLAELFDQIATSRRKFGILHPKKFVTKVKKENATRCPRVPELPPEHYWGPSGSSSARGGSARIQDMDTGHIPGNTDQ
jgi:hypothetical protein